MPPHNPNYGSNPARHHQDGYPEGRNRVGKTEGNRHNPGRPRPGGYLPGYDHGGYPAGHYHEESDARTIYDQEMQTQAQEQIQKQRTLQGNLTKLDRFDFQEFAGTKDHLFHTA